MELKYGIYKHERAIGTITEFSSQEGHGFMKCHTVSKRNPHEFQDKVLIRESEVLYPCEEYNIPTDGVSKDMSIGNTFGCTLIETSLGLMALGAVRLGTCFAEDINPNGEGIWPNVRFPRFIGVVKHWSIDECYGFITTDSLRNEAFFNKKEFLIPYECMVDPYNAITMSPKMGDMVTFDLIETPRKLRAIGVKSWEGDGT